MKKKWIIYALIFVGGFLTNALFLQYRINFNISIERDNASNVENVDTTQSEDSTQQNKVEVAVANGEMVELPIDELRSMVYEQFNGGVFYKIGDQVPVEYLNKYLPANAGSSVEYWLKPTANYKTTPAFLLDDGSSQIDITTDTNKEMLMSFIPEIYEIKDDGIYAIDNDGVYFIYIKADLGSINTYIDYVFGGESSEIGVFRMTSSQDSDVYVETDPVYEIYPVSDFYHASTKTGAVFNGYFYNIDHSKPEVFLKNGPQTSNNAYQGDLKNFNTNKNLSTLMEIYKYISETKYHNGEGEKFGRSVDDIMESKLLTGCTDYGLLFASLARDKGIPTIFLQTARIDWIYDRVRNMDSGITGHILIEVYIDGKWRLVDSTAGRYYPDYDYNNFSLNDGYYVFAKSIEVWDSGVKNEQENSSMMSDLFKNFNVDAYKDPVYDYIDLRTGNTVKGTAFNFGQKTVTKASDAN